MKTKSALCLLLALLLLLAGCGGSPALPADTDGTGTSGTKTDPAPDGPVWQPLPDYDPSVPHMEKLNSSEYFVETAHGVVFANEGRLRYMDKETGEVRLLCDDPACDHIHSETCPAIIGSSCPLLYVPENGRLYYARPYRGNDGYVGYYVVSVDVDGWDLTLRFHTKTKTEDTIELMSSWDGRIYYTRRVYENAKNYCDFVSVELESFSLTGTSVRTEMSFPAPNGHGFIGMTGFVVNNGVVYYGHMKTSSSLNVLHAYDLSTWADTELHVPETRKRKKGEKGDSYKYAYYFCCGGRMYCASDTYLKELDMDGNEIRELWRNEGDPYNPRWAIGADGTLYGLDYDPRTIEVTLKDNTTVETTVNPSGGKILCWRDGVPQVYADLGERRFIDDFTVIGDRVFIRYHDYDDEKKASRSNLNNRLTYHLCYTFGGRVYEIPEEGFPQG